MLGAICNWYDDVYGSLLSLIIATLCLMGYLLSWWKPYLFGCSENWRRKYNEKFSRTIKIFPPIKDHPIPDAEHLPVGVLTIIWLIATLLNYNY